MSKNARIVQENLTSVTVAIEQLNATKQDVERNTEEIASILANLRNRIATLEAGIIQMRHYQLQQRIEKIQARPQISMETVTQIRSNK